MSGHREDANLWILRALCRYEGRPSDWDDTLDLPDDHREPLPDRAARIERAKAVCHRCPVQLECASRVDMRTGSGVWFGIHLEAWREEQARLGGVAVRNRDLPDERRSA